MTRRWTCLALLIAFFCPGLRAAGPPPSWRPIGPYGARMTALLADPKRPGVVFAGTDAGLYRSLNGGTTWQPVLPEGPLGVYTGALAAGPSSIYATSDFGETGGLFESRDGGTTWAFLGPRFAGVIAMEADRVSSTLFILDYSPSLRRSTDGGKHWTEVSLLKIPCPTQVAADRGASGTFYVGTCRGKIFRTTDGGASWKSSDLSTQLGGDRLHALAVDPVTHAVYTGGGLSGVLSSTNGGVSWRQVLLPPDQLGVNALAARGGVVYAAAGTYIPFRPLISELFVSTNGGKTWRGAPQETGNAAIEALAVDPRKSQTVYIGVHSWGVFKSSDAAVHWTLANKGLRGTEVKCMALDASHPGTILAGTDGAGLWKTSDGGGTWSVLNASLGSVQALALDPRHPATIFAASRGLLQRSQDGGAHWTTLTQGLERTFVTGPLNIDPQVPDSVYVLTLTGLSHSSDGGAIWSAPVPVPQCTSPRALVASPDGTVYLGGERISGCFQNEGLAGGVYASTDGGSTWKDLWQGFGDVLQLHRHVYSLALDPADPSTLYVGGFTLSFSTDGGATWQDIPRGGPILSLALGAGQPPTIYIGSIGEIDISTDAGASWAIYYTPGGFYARTRQLAYDATTGISYAATELGLYSFATH